jgi:ABC-type multidrug transport system permease subunit
MLSLILTTNPALITGLLASTVTIVFSFVLSRIIDHALNQNLKILQELIAIRKEMNSANPDARKMDEIIIYRRKRYLKRQIDSYEKMKSDDRKVDAKTALRGDNKFKNFLWKVTNSQWVLGIVALVAIIVTCVCCAILLAGIITNIS